MTISLSRLKSQFYQKLTDARGCPPCSIDFCRWVFDNEEDLDRLIGDKAFASDYFDVENVCKQYTGGHISELDLSIGMQEIGDA